MPQQQQTAAASPDHRSIRARLDGRSIVLVGMMGAGKSSVGRRLAARLGLPFVDADAEIEAAAGCSIPDIFANHGEAHFREGERKVIARLLDSGPQVLATGGGAWMNPVTRANVAGRGISIWLHADVDVLLRRVRRRSDRPLLQGTDMAARLKSLSAERDPVYAQADIIVRSREVPHETVVDEIVQALVLALPECDERATPEPAGRTRGAEAP